MTTHQEKMLEELHVAIVGNEKFGHIGLVKKQQLSDIKVAELELQIDLFMPVLESFKDKKVETKKLRSTIIAACVTFVLSLAGHIVSLILINNK